MSQWERKGGSFECKLGSNNSGIIIYKNLN